MFTLAPTTAGASAGDYTLTLNGQVDLPQETLEFSNENIKAGGPAGAVIVFTDATQTTSELLITGSPLVNASNGFVGISNNGMEPGETITYQFGTVNTTTFTVTARELVDEINLSVFNEAGPGTDDLNWTAYVHFALAANPFATTITDATVTVTQTAHGFAVGDTVVFSGASPVGGLNVNGTWLVGTVVDDGHYTFEHTSVATSTATGGGTSAESAAVADSGSIFWDGPGETPPTIDADTAFDTIVFTVPPDSGGGDDNTFKMGGVSFTNVSDPEPVVLSIPFLLTDGDGDIAVDPDSDGVFLVNIIPGDGDADANVAAPVVLDLDGDGLEFMAIGDALNNVLFDFNGNGIKETSAWVAPDDGFLVLDINGDRVVNDGSEMDFARGHPDANTDLEGLRLVFDSNGDGVLTADDAEFSRFGVWQDANANGITEEGEFKTLDEMGIVSLDLSSNGVSYTTANDEVTVHGEASFTYQDGSQGLMGDVSLAIGGSTDTDFIL